MDYREGQGQARLDVRVIVESFKELIDCCLLLEIDKIVMFYSRRWPVKS